MIIYQEILVSCVNSEQRARARGAARGQLASRNLDEN